MDFKDQNKILAFDTLFCTNHIQMLKILLPYMDNQMQRSLAVYIKFQEFKYTIDFYTKNPYSTCEYTKQTSPPDISKICSELLPYCTEEEKKKIEQFKGLFRGFEMYQELSKTMEIMKEFMPDMDIENIFQNFGNTTTSEENNSNFDMMNLLKNMLSPEQQEMFELFGGMNHAD